MMEFLVGLILMSLTWPFLRWLLGLMLFLSAMLLLAVLIMSEVPDFDLPSPHPCVETQTQFYCGG